MVSVLKGTYRAVYIGIPQGAYKGELLFDTYLYQFKSIYYFCNLNTLLKRTHF